MCVRFASMLALLFLSVTALPCLRAQAAAAPNLRGEVMILVYHRFGAEARWSRSLDNFSHDLARLDAAGFRPITLRQYITGDFDLPAGTTPVVLTFDDSTDVQVRFTPDGKLDPECALGRWQAFASTHPEFPVHGTFFINPGTDVFGQRAYIKQKLDLLVGLGSEIGNHTFTHPYLNKLQPPAIQEEIGLGQWGIDHWLPGYEVTSFALPFGIAPQPYNLAVASSWSGKVCWDAAHDIPARCRRPADTTPVTVSWHYAAVVLVGSGPAPSPLVAGLNGARLPRIQVFNPEFDKWMGYFSRYPRRRFISDGERHAPGSLPAAARSLPVR